MLKIQKFFKKIIDSIKGSPTRLIVLSFALVIFVGAFLLSLPFSHNSYQWFSFGDALFTATSATCVTGLIAVDTATQFSIFGQIIILLLIQIGGLGVMTGTTMIFMVVGRKLSLKNQLVIKETLNEYKIISSVKLISKIVLYTLIIELVGALILMCSFVPEFGAKGIWVSIFTSISAFCNAGFDIMGIFHGEFNSVMSYASNAFVLLPIMSLIVMGGLGFMVMSDIRQNLFKNKLKVHTRLVLLTTAILLVLGWIVFAAAEWNNSLKDMSVGGKLLSSLFQSVAPRTAGFNSIDQATLTPISYLMTLILMFIGASPASTGGGIKTTTLVCIILVTIATLQGKHEVTINRSTISRIVIRKAVTVIFMAVSVILFATMALLIAENGKEYGLTEILFEVISAFSTTGLSMGITANLTAFSKVVLGFAMFIGRVGTLTIGASIVKTHSSKQVIKYSDAKIMVG